MHVQRIYHSSVSKTCSNCTLQRKATLDVVEVLSVNVGSSVGRDSCRCGMTVRARDAQNARGFWQFGGRLHKTRSSYLTGVQHAGIQWFHQYAKIICKFRMKMEIVSSNLFDAKFPRAWCPWLIRCPKNRSSFFIPWGIGSESLLPDGNSVDPRGILGALPLLEF